FPKCEKSAVVEGAEHPNSACYRAPGRFLRAVVLSNAISLDGVTNDRAVARQPAGLGFPIIAETVRKVTSAVFSRLAGIQIPLVRAASFPLFFSATASTEA